VALSALENLRSRGKTIGLISHVELLKDRLTTQVRVVRGAGGTSRIEVVA
jgi:exonuclease SbcC